MATTIVTEENFNSTLVKVVASGGRESILFDIEWSASKDYTHIILDEIAYSLSTSTEIISEVNYLDKDKAKTLHT